MIERNGECWKLAAEKMIADRHNRIVLVHGLPTGLSGPAAEVGKYCHAWLEYLDWGVVWEPLLDAVIDKDFYYGKGKILEAESTRYSRELLHRMITKHGTYGQWAKRLLERDEVIENANS